MRRIENTMFQLKPDFEQVMDRYEAWWDCQIIDRPLVCLRFPREESGRIPPLKAKNYESHWDRWMDVEYRTETAAVGLHNTVHFADALPVAYPNLGPEIFSAFYGCKMVYSSGTGWSEPNSIYKKETPVGTIQQVRRNGWHYEDFIKTPEDYKIMQWIVENTELSVNYHGYQQAEELARDYGIVILSASRTPAMSINVDWAGTQQFCMDVALEVPELFDLYEARKKQILEEYRLIAEGPGRYVKIWENLTISMLCCFT
jgi:hypothetical protein